MFPPLSESGNSHECFGREQHAGRARALVKTIHRLAVINAVVAVVMVVAWLSLGPPDAISIATDVLVPFGVGLATYLGGRFNGALWLIVPAIRLFVQQGAADSLVSMIESALVYAFTSVVIFREARASVARDQLRALIAAMNDVVLVLDEDGHYREVAQTGGLISRPEELVGRNLSDLFTPEQSAFFLSKIREALSSQQTVTVNYALVINGVERSFNAAVSPMHGGKVVWVARDVTEVKATEKALYDLNVQLENRISVRTRELAHIVGALTESQERFELVARATNDVIWDWDLVRNDLWMSEAYGERFGGNPPQLDGWTELIHPDDRDRVSAALHAAIESDGAQFIAEYRYRREDGSYASVLDRGHVVRDETGRGKRMIGAMIDLTDHRRLVERLEQEKRVSGLGRIAASIAHEFNNLTMGIQSNLEVVQRFALPQMQPALEHVFAAISRSKRITEQILRYTRPMPPETRSIPVKRFLDDWKVEIAAVLPESIALDVRMEDPDLLMEADPLQIAQVLTNLALNAKDAMLPGGGTLIVDVFAEQEKLFGQDDVTMIHFRVTDTGCGMTTEELSNAFEPLFTTKRHGTGLGLAVSQQIAVQHGGHLSGESRHGAGSTFHLLLPASRRMAEGGAPVSREPADFPYRQILLVEDDPAVAAGLVTLLESAGLDVVTAHDGASAIALARQSPPDCVILDVGLPDMHGSSVFDGIRAIWPAVPVVFSSGHAGEALLRPYLSRERVTLLVKPYSFAELTEALRAVSA